MFVVSSKWIFLNNKKLEKDKSLLIDGSVIKDIIDTKSVKKLYTNIIEINYPNHILMPSFAESYVDMNDCLNKADIDRKISKFLENGITKLQVVSKDYSQILKHDVDNNLDMSYIITFNGDNCNQIKIKEMINIIDFYKSDPTKRFSINLENVLQFENNIIEKLSSIAHEINTSIHIQGDDLSKTKDISKIKKIVSFWDSINLLDNCYLHGFFNKNEDWLSCVNKKNIKLMINYIDINSPESIKKLLSFMQNKYTCILISNKNGQYSFYELINLINSVNPQSFNSISSKIFDCVTLNTSDIFLKSNNSDCIKKGLYASFNVFDYTINKFIINDDTPNLGDLDNRSLCNVWSAGKQIIL